MGALVGFIGLVGIAAVVVGIIAIARGGVRSMRIASRKQGGLLILGALVVLAVGGALAPPTASSKHVAAVAPAVGPRTATSSPSPSVTPSPSPSALTSPSASPPTMSASQRTTPPAPARTIP